MGSGKAMRRKQTGVRWPAVFLAFLALVSLASLASRYPAESNELSFTPAVGDLGGLAGAEIVTVSPDGKLYVWNRDRSLAFGFPKEFEGGIDLSPALADLDHDGYREILVVVKNPSGGLNLRAFYGNGIEAPGYPISLAFVPSSPLTAADVDKDGLVEIIGGSSDGQLHIWRAGNPGELPGFPKPLSSQPVSITLGDLDYDEVLEIIAGSRDGKVYALDYTQSEQNEGKPGSWTTSPVLAVGRQIAGVPVVSDLDQDGQADLLVAGSDVDQKSLPLTVATPLFIQLRTPSALTFNPYQAVGVNSVPVTAALTYSVSKDALVTAKVYKSDPRAGAAEIIRTLANEDTYDDGFRDGQAAAESVNGFSAALTTGLTTIAGGLFLGEIGTSIGTGIGVGWTLRVPAKLQKSLEGKSPEYQKGFVKGYQKKATTKTLWPSVIGGFMGYIIVHGH